MKRSMELSRKIACAERVFWTSASEFFGTTYPATTFQAWLERHSIHRHAQTFIC